ncbi:hypothetical protein EG68_11942 [Paragonimus skrjabini miyazakii]|uniref:Uncharacterized protein n=1 Tax=Paragonimus skrjabini miyazakii TaxID=59628 RepID=A0A8S9YDS0_9TREM|nr:hypothetical protein EG68_11942 [Paragonimus skrjabini miyazakii]
MFSELACRLRSSDFDAMAEACRPKKNKNKTSDLLAQLEKITVPDYPLSEDEEQKSASHVAIPVADEEPQEIVDPISQGNTVKQAKSLSTVDEPLANVTSLYPCLNDESATQKPVAEVVDMALNSVPIPPEHCAEYVLPAPLESTCLRNLYINHPLENVGIIEANFLLELDGITQAVDFGVEGRNSFEILLSKYTHFWNQWRYAVDRFYMVRKEACQLGQRLWKLQKRCSTVSVCTCVPTF